MWHYQWILLHDYLPALIGAELATELANEGPRYYALGDEPYIPFEFADAAFRYGHSQIRHRYRINATMSGLPMFPDLMGFGAVPPERAVDWSLLFDLPGKPPAQRAKRMDGRLPASLINLPAQITGDVDDEAYHSLAARDLQRGQAIGLPSGEAIARYIGAEPARPGRHRALEPRLARRDAALVLHPPRGRRRRRRRPARAGRRPHRRRGAGRPAERRPRVVPHRRSRLAADAARRRPRALQSRRPARNRHARQWGRPMATARTWTRST